LKTILLLNIFLELLIFSAILYLRLNENLFMRRKIVEYYALVMHHTYTDDHLHQQLMLFFKRINLNLSHCNLNVENRKRIFRKHRKIPPKTVTLYTISFWYVIQLAWALRRWAQFGIYWRRSKQKEMRYFHIFVWDLEQAVFDSDKCLVIMHGPKKSTAILNANFIFNVKSLAHFRPL
jgi:hypothetical protein